MVMFYLQRCMHPLKVGVFSGIGRRGTSAAGLGPTGKAEGRCHVGYPRVKSSKGHPPRFFLLGLSLFLSFNANSQLLAFTRSLLLLLPLPQSRLTETERRKMERWRDGIGISPQRRGKNYPSFSSTLLDAIYRSIDETGEWAATNEHRDGGGRDPFSARKKQCDAYSVHRSTPPMIPAEVTRSGREHWGRRNPSPVTRSGREHWSTAAATSSSSDVSSYGGFSSSEAESITASHSARLRPIRTSSVGSSTFPARFGQNHPSAVPPPLPPVVTGGDEKRGKKERHGSIRSRLMRELRKGRAPATPGSRFANFLNSLFPAKSKLSGDSVASGEDSACSTASSYSRSCLSKTPSSRGKTGSGKRTVRFNPSSVIVDEDCRPCGEKFDGSGNRPTLRESAPVRRVSDLAVIGRFQDELPVYETTIFSGYSGISHGMLV